MVAGAHALFRQERGGEGDGRHARVHSQSLEQKTIAADTKPTSHVVALNVISDNLVNIGRAG
jgi:hypothetical protein